MTDMYTCTLVHVKNFLLKFLAEQSELRLHRELLELWMQLRLGQCNTQCDVAYLDNKILTEHSFVLCHTIVIIIIAAIYVAPISNAHGAQGTDTFIGSFSSSPKPRRM